MKLGSSDSHLARFFPWAVTVLCLVYLIAAARPIHSTGPFNVRQFAQLPVSYKGRVKPIDSVARNTLLMLSHKQTTGRHEQRVSAIEWLLDVLARPSIAEQHKVFRIAHPEALALLGLSNASGVMRVSVSQLFEHRDEVVQHIQEANLTPAAERDSYQRSMVKLGEHISLYEGLRPPNMAFLHLIPPPSQEHDWMTMSDAVQLSRESVGTRAWNSMIVAYNRQDADEFNQALAAYESQLRRIQPTAVRKAQFETIFNQYAPFYRGTILYVVVGLLTCLSWLGWSRPLTSTAHKLLLLVLIVHTAGLVARIYLSGRPPVTNLYASAVFIGWACVVLCVLLERCFRNGVGTLVASATGFLTLIIAHHLGRSGDTMAVLQAVLDTNLWLATHVVVITLGYASTYLAGCFGIIYIFRGLLTRTLTETENRRMGQMVYGIVCFGLLLSFVGTLLGGLWADQSWGRFWGWDPKENGALLIVVWNALILHARWGGMVRERGMAVLAVFGNIVTTWSWYGTNMLGVGLHAYGFIDSALFWLTVFVASQFLVIGLGCAPLRYWRSFHAGSRLSENGPTSNNRRGSGMTPRPRRT